MLYLVALAHWLAVIHWVRLPHWSAYFGWLALAGYLAIYIPCFIWLSRAAHHRLRIPLLLAAPLVWCGLEFFRGTAFTGFALALLGHTQANQILLIQCADLGGAYTVSLLIVMVSTAFALAIAANSFRQRWLYIGLVVAMPAIALGYGQFRVAESAPPNQPTARVALIQGSIDTRFDDPADPRQTFLGYLTDSKRLLQEQGPVDLIVWPESMYTGEWPLVTIQEKPFQLLANSQLTADHIFQLEQIGRQRMASVAGETGTPMLVGCERIEFHSGEPKRYNSALLIGRDGQLVASYDKMHPVMFGEYVPLGNLFPWLYKLHPMRVGLTAGSAPQIMQAGELALSPSICFENMVPQLVRRQVRQLQASGTPPDVLVTITNDGWFWGSSLLDVHLACGVFRTIENRMPMLIAANTGFSAWIDGSGRVIEKGPRRKRGTIVANVTPDPRGSIYRTYGDWLGRLCACFCFVCVVAGVMASRKERSVSTDLHIPSC